MCCKQFVIFCYKHKCLYLIANISSVIANLIILFLLRPRIISFDNLGFDYIGVIVGILALLVTVLIGWQVLNIVDLNNKIRKAIEEDREKMKNEIYKEITDKIESHRKEDLSWNNIIAFMIASGKTPEQSILETNKLREKIKNKTNQK